MNIIFVFISFRIYTLINSKSNYYIILNYFKNILHLHKKTENKIYSYII